MNLIQHQCMAYEAHQHGSNQLLRGTKSVGMRERTPDFDSDSDEGYNTACAHLQKAMAKLTSGGLRGLVPATPDDDGWSTMVKESTIKVKQGLATEEQCKGFSAVYNQYFESVYGKNIDFIITPLSQPYVSVLEACMERDRVLRPLFDERPVVFDPMGGCGGDAVAMLTGLYPRKYILCDHFNVADDLQEREWNTLNHNLRNLRNAFEELRPPPEGETNDAPVVVTTMMDCKEYIMQMPMGTRVDLLNLDPNWSISAKSKYELTPEGLIHYINSKVIAPLNEREIKPKCIVFKTRWASTILEPFMRLLTKDYHCTYSVEATPFREHVDEVRNRLAGEVEGRFHWMIIVHNALKEVVWRKSKLYMDVVRRKRSVIVKKKDLLRPKIPLYADRVILPAEQTHETEGETILVKATRHAKKPPRPRHD